MIAFVLLIVLPLAAVLFFVLIGVGIHNGPKVAEGKRVLEDERMRRQARFIVEAQREADQPDA